MLAERSFSHGSASFSGRERFTFQITLVKKQAVDVKAILLSLTTVIARDAVDVDQAYVASQP